MMHNSISGWLWFLYDLSFGTFKFGTSFFTYTLDIAVLKVSIFDKPATEVFHGVLSRRSIFDLFFRAICFDVGATGMWIEQPKTQVHQDRTLASADMFHETGSCLIGCHGVGAINLFCIDTATFGPFNQVACPLNGRGSSNSPTVILNDHQNRELVDSSLAKQNIEIIGCHPTIATSE